MKRVFIDMDNVLVDFQSGLDQVSEETKKEYADRLDEIPGLFAKMKPMEGAIEAVHELQKYYVLQDNGFYKAVIPAEKRDEVKDLFRQTGFSAGAELRA